jgi:APA family basic amino acid/polyamine antiporter
VSILSFCSVALAVLVFAALPSLAHGAYATYNRFFHGEAGLDVLADLYAFGAATSYSFVFVALIALRLKDPLSPRKFRIPLNIPVRFRGEAAEFPIVGVVGFAGIFSILIFTMLTHPIGRIAGPLWLIGGVVVYLFYRRRKGLPLFGPRPVDWWQQQITILKDAGELELMDELVEKLRARGKLPASSVTESV